MAGIFRWNGSNWGERASQIWRWESNGNFWVKATGVYMWDGVKWVQIDIRTGTTSFSPSALRAESSAYQGGGYNNTDMRTGTWSGANYQGWAFGSISKLGTVTKVNKVKINLTKGSSGGTYVDTIKLYYSNNTNTSTAPGTAGSTLVGAGADIWIGAKSGAVSTTVDRNANANDARVCDIVMEFMNKGGSISMWNGSATNKYSNYTSFTITNIEYEYV